MTTAQTPRRPVVRQLQRPEAVEMLRREAAKCGLDLREFYELGHADRLDDGKLRDLWLIWGDVLTEDDLPPKPKHEPHDPSATTSALRQPVVRKIARDDTVEMLREAAAKCGLEFDRFYDLGHADKLENPYLRDLWLIWGDILTEEDVRPVT